MGGVVGVSSEVGRGSTFWVELALAEVASVAPAASDRAPVRVAALPETRGTVLYIEDNPSNMRLMERVLERRPGVRLCHAPDGHSGLAAALAHPPDLIFLDLHLPDLRGEEVLRRLSEDVRLRQIPVAVLTADATAEQARRLKAAGACAYITKPIEISELLRLVDDRLRHHAEA
jgi:CheY-like chemotaxis protein